MKVNKNNLTVFTLLFVIGNSNANIPYPIIFVHGLGDSHETWEETIEEIQEVENFPNLEPPIVYHVCLNHDGEDETAFFEPGDNGENDVAEVRWTQFGNLDVIERNDINEESRLFAINFKEEIFRDIDGEDDNHNNHDHSNTAAIYKQGYALGLMIGEVLEITGRDKVILVGHSMGGLAIRENLQRTDNGEPDGEHLWWFDPDDEDHGHRVAKVVTTGTPHLGSDFGYIDPVLSPQRDDEFVDLIITLEALRDLRYSYHDFNEEINGLYLFGGNERDIYGDNWVERIIDYMNFDVNCNGHPNLEDDDPRFDNIVGLNNTVEVDGNLERGTTFNAQMPLNSNIWYTWIVSDLWGIGGDGMVLVDKQYLYDENGHLPRGHSNVLLINAPHTAEPMHFQSIITALDEPNRHQFSYKINTNWEYTYGLFTPQPENNSDVDWYKFRTENEGSAKLSLDMASIRAMNIDEWNLSIFMDVNEDAIASINEDNPNNGVLNFDIENDTDYYIQFRGSNDQEDWYDHPYRFRLRFIEDEEVEPVILIPVDYFLSAGYPNPFNNTTRLSYDLPEAVNVKIQIYDLSGRLVITLTNGKYEAGHHYVTWDADNFATGIYLVRMRAGEFESVRKVTLLK